MSLTIIQRRAGTELAEAMADIDSLLEAVERADAQRPLSDHMWLDLRQGGRPGFAGLLGWQDDHDHLVAYCQVSRGNESWSLDLVIHPHHRYEMTTIGPEMLRAAINIIQAEGGGHVHWWVFEPTPTYTSLGPVVGRKQPCVCRPPRARRLVCTNTCVTVRNGLVQSRRLVASSRK